MDTIHFNYNKWNILPMANVSCNAHTRKCASSRIYWMEVYVADGDYRLLGFIEWHRSTGRARARGDTYSYICVLARRWKIASISIAESFFLVWNWIAFGGGEKVDFVRYTPDSGDIFLSRLWIFIASWPIDCDEITSDHLATPPYLFDKTALPHRVSIRQCIAVKN